MRRLGGDLGHRLERPDLVVGVHQRDEDCVDSHGREDLVRVEASVRARRDEGGLDPLAPEGAQGLEDRGVLDRARDVTPTESSRETPLQSVADVPMSGQMARGGE